MKMILNRIFSTKFILLLFLNFLTLSSSAKTLKLVTIYYPPYIFEENNEVKGLSVDIVKKVFQKMNQEVEIHIQPWVRSQQDIKDGNADVIFTVFKNSERELFMDFNQIPIVNQNISFYSLKGTSIKFAGDFKNISPFKVGIVRGVSYGALFKQAVDDKILNTEESYDYEKCVLKLKEGRTKIIIGNEAVVNYIINKIKLKHNEFIKISPRVESLPSYIAFSKKADYSQIKKKFDETFKKMKKDGEYNKIIKKWSDKYNIR